MLLYLVEATGDISDGEQGLQCSTDVEDGVEKEGVRVSTCVRER